MSWFLKENPKFKALELSITTLFIHAAKLDGIYSEIEKETIIKSVKKFFIAEDEYIKELISECEILEENKNQILHLTQEVKKLDYTERLKIIEMLIEIIYSDRTIHEFEDNLIRRVAGLTYIESADLGAIKIKIKKKLSI